MEPVQYSIMMCQKRLVNLHRMIYVGEYEPINPVSNGNEIAENLSNFYLVTAFTYGYSPSPTRIVKQLTLAFINNIDQRFDSNGFQKGNEISFVKDITINSGVAGNVE